MRRLGYLLTLVVAMMFCATAGFAQDGKLKIKVIPKHAYVFVDVKPFATAAKQSLSARGSTLSLS